MHTIIGIDVSKATLHAHLRSQPNYEKARKRVFSNTTAGFQELRDWACHHSQGTPQTLHIIVEATGCYHDALCYWLHAAGAVVSVVNPAQLKSFAKGVAVQTKTDDHDAAVLARYGILITPKPWQPPAPEIRQLNALLQRLETLQTDCHRERRRAEHAELAQAPAIVLESLQHQIDGLQQEQQRLEQAIERHIADCPHLQRDQQLLESIPAVGRKTAWLLLCLLRAHNFQRAPQVAAFLGLVPVEHRSGSSIHRRARLSKQGSPRLRAALYMPSVVAITHNPTLRALYERLLKNGKAKMAALCAVSRKLLHIAFGVLKHQTPFRETLTNNL